MNKPNRFDFTNITPEKLIVIEGVRDKFKELLEYLEQNSKPSREQALAFTKLEEASMWINKALCNE